MSDTDHNGPLQTLRDGAVFVKLWKQEGRQGPYVTATPGRTYQDQEGAYGEARSFSRNDMLKLGPLMTEAQKEMARWNTLLRGRDPEPEATPQDGLPAQRDAAMARTKVRPRVSRARRRGREPS